MTAKTKTGADTNANATKSEQVIAASDKYLMPNYGRRILAAARGQGSRLWDADGNEYLDFFGGFGGAGVAGHCHPAIVKAIQKQAETLLCHGNLFASQPQIDLARMITEHGFGGKVFYCHSGAEANEAAMKLVRMGANIGAAAGAKRRYKIVRFQNCFHGRTMGALSLTPEKYQQGFEPMVPGTLTATYGDIKSVQAVVDDETAGVFIEPIQGEGGMNIPPLAFMLGLRKLCDDMGLLMVMDEVWTAPARTGKWFAHQHYGITPDVMTLGKATGGGATIAACVAAPKWADTLTAGKHGCTMGGNPLCAAAGVAAFKLIEQEKLVERAAAKGEEIMQAIRAAKIGCVKDVRGKGLFLGIELDKEAKPLFQAAMAKGLLIGTAQTHVLRLAPALNTPDDVLEKGMEIFLSVLRS